MTSDQLLPIRKIEVPAFLAKAASGGGRLLNSVMVFIGDHLGAYRTGQLSFDLEDHLLWRLQRLSVDRVTHKPAASVGHPAEP